MFLRRFSSLEGWHSHGYCFSRDSVYSSVKPVILSQARRSHLLFWCFFFLKCQYIPQLKTSQPGSWLSCGYYLCKRLSLFFKGMYYKVGGIMLYGAATFLEDSVYSSAEHITTSGGDWLSCGCYFLEVSVYSSVGCISLGGVMFCVGSTLGQCSVHP